ncbi:hypothetical protein [Nocardia arizonensis]|uniref:hypothetical protein n=1 Tax=Nocardia arizonensis TaxID=1141647 RepID=UPI0006D237B9|nr:hypothetical protein [Nocardia arizonensis]
MSVDPGLTRQARQELANVAYAHLLRPLRTWIVDSTVEGYLSQFGADPRGAGRMLTKLRMADLLRRPRLTGSGLEPGTVGENPPTPAHSDT